MPKYLSLWEMDDSKMPTAPDERAAVMTKMIALTKQYLKDNPGGEWGAFIGENKGYGIGGKTPQDIIKLTFMFAPYVKFKTYQTVSIDEVEEVFKAMMAQMPPK